ncbi:hypothetical protein DPMN_134212 [Dreissena polymorpha]|uniref:Uncharacterized protein n=1 Tax=Dreissena polymorpha TaxID=45954 RepID=A0A9D4FWT8_DREPO|nr:hypothetical protein DPMN_134212 [Dreissena polymorpha]
MNKLNCNLVRDNLYIGNKVYNLDTGSLEVPKPRSRTNYEKPQLQQNTHKISYAPWNQQSKAPIDFRGKNRFEVLNSDQVDTPQRRRQLIERAPRTHVDETELKRPREQDSTTSTDLVQMPEILEQPEQSIKQRFQFNTSVQLDAQGENRCSLHNNKHGSVSRCVRELKFRSLTFAD